MAQFTIRPWALPRRRGSAWRDVDSESHAIPGERTPAQTAYDRLRHCARRSFRQSKTCVRNSAPDQCVQKGLSGRIRIPVTPAIRMDRADHDVRPLLSKTGRNLATGSPEVMRAAPVEQVEPMRC